MARIEPIATRGLTRASEARQSGAAASILARWSRSVSLRMVMVIGAALASVIASTLADAGPPVEGAGALVEEKGQLAVGCGSARRQFPRLYIAHAIASDASIDNRKLHHRASAPR